MQEKRIQLFRNSIEIGIVIAVLALNRICMQKGDSPNYLNIALSNEIVGDVTSFAIRGLQLVKRHKGKQSRLLPATYFRNQASDKHSQRRKKHNLLPPILSKTKEKIMMKT